MDFDNRKVYGDTSITDGLVSIAPVAVSSELSIVRMGEVGRLSANEKNIVFARITNPKIAQEM